MERFPKDSHLKAYFKQALNEGWSYRKTKAGWILRHPDQRQTIGFHDTPSDWRAMRNLRADFRRAGVSID